MGVFNTQNAFVAIVTDDMDAVYANPAQQIAPDKLKLIGICKSDSGFKITENEVVTSTDNENTVLSYKSEVDLKLLTKLNPAVKNIFESQKVDLVFLDPKFWNISQDDLIDNIDLTLAHNRVSPFSHVILAPQKIRIEDEYKFGSGKVTELTLKNTLIAETKAELFKELSV
jgi:hypothetical protein